MKKVGCCWCPGVVEVDDDYNPLKDLAFCHPSCDDADFLFRKFFSDEEMNRRAHYAQLTRGVDYDEHGQSEQGS